MVRLLTTCSRDADEELVRPCLRNGPVDRDGRFANFVNYDGLLHDDLVPSRLGFNEAWKLSTWGEGYVLFYIHDMMYPIAQGGANKSLLSLIHI